MADISLTASMRSNLLSLQQTQSLMDTTQERLSTGKKVNSAIDNPSSYYTAQSLTNRASDLSSLLDSMGQAVQTIQAANEGIEAITEFANQAKAIATSANDTSDGESIKNYMSQFDEILKQIDGIAKDSGYKGVNLLEKDQELKVVFNEDRSSSLTVKSDDASSEGLGLKSASTTGSEWAKDVEQTGAVAKFATKTQFAQNSFVYDGSGKVYKVATAIQNTNEDSIEALVEAGTLEETDFVLNDDKSKAVDVTINKDAISNSITEVENAVSKLRNMASVFGNNYSIVENRESFTENLINVLEEGADKLTLADMNEESANMLALQTRQQLAINSLSLASQAAQSVLSLF
ncbi:MAG: flagellin [Alphaproteobacteria bacterium]